MKPRLSNELGVPEQAAISLSVQISNLKKKDLTLDELKETIIETWEKHFKKLDTFWGDLPNLIDIMFDKKINYLDQWETNLLDREERISDRERRHQDAVVDKLTEDIFLKLDDLLNKGISPDLAAQLLMIILEFKKTIKTNVD